MRSHVWGNVKLDTTGLIDRKTIRLMSDASIYAFSSMEQAITDADLSPGAYQNSPRIGLIASSGDGPLRFQVLSTDIMRGPRGLKTVSPYVVIRATASGVLACLATPFKAHGTSYFINSACATSAYRIGGAVEQVQLGKRDIVLVGGGKELCWEMAYEFDAMGALSTKYNDTPEKASRIYDTHRDGFAITDNGGMVVIEELEHILACGAHTYAGTAGYGATSDGADMVALSSEGAVRCMKMVMHGVDIPTGYLNSHGTSTPVGDVKELATTREVFGGKSPAISATKAMTGHSLGATGIQEVIYSLLILEHGFIASDINIKELDEQAAGLNIVAETTSHELTTATSNSFGFGGTNATLVMRKLKD